MLTFIFINSAAARYCGQKLQHTDLDKSIGGCTTSQPQPSVADQNGGRINRCCPYDFDSRLCKTIGDRILCGYDRNIGRPESQDHEMQLGQGCRIRGGRLECGYIHGPFTNPRRPPGYDQESNKADNNDDDNIIKIEDTNNDIDNTGKLALKEVETTTKKSTKQPSFQFLYSHLPPVAITAAMIANIYDSLDIQLQMAIKAKKIGFSVYNHILWCVLFDIEQNSRSRQRSPLQRAFKTRFSNVLSSASSFDHTTPIQRS
ncbi:hypothetical protein evm_011599 [Chilo suppressalis]|nr:hypothetical protein evm_011599 [Chilo suppressalis]